MPGIAFAVIGAVGVTLFQWYLQMGLLLFMLKVARGEPFEFSDLFYVGPQVLPFFGATFLFALAVAAGFILLIVPGIILSLIFSQVQYLVLDRRIAVFDSFSASDQMTHGNKLNLFLVWLLGGLLGMAATLLTCGLGIFVAGPCFALGRAVIYLTLSGEPTADMQSPFAPPPQ